MFWSQIEVFTGMIAVCIPVLKNAAERGMRRFGLLSSGGFNSTRTMSLPTAVGSVSSERCFPRETGAHQNVQDDGDWTWLNLAERLDHGSEEKAADTY